MYSIFNIRLFLIKKMKLFTGLQPSGSIHIGNYISMQHREQSYIAIVDLHSLTSIYNYKILQDNILETFAIYYSIYKEQSIIFLQSQIPYHAHLAWLLSCFTKIGDLNRMTQYKDKKNNLNNTLGLYSYPVLMAADILLYNAQYVKVGDDQKQHLELVHKIIDHYQYITNDSYFIKPKIIINNSRIMNLRDVNIKMSKSLGNINGVINILDDNDTILSKIMKAKTDSQLIDNNIDRIELQNLKNIFEAFNGTFNEMIGKNFSYFKQKLSEVIIDTLAPIRKEALQLLNDKVAIINLIKENSDKVKYIAENNIKNIMLLNPLCYHIQKNI